MQTMIMPNNSKMSAMFVDSSTDEAVLIDWWRTEVWVDKLLTDPNCSQCDQVRTMVKASNSGPVPVAIFGALIKDDAYLHQRMLFADRHTTYAIANGDDKWPPKMPPGLQLSHFATPTIAMDDSTFGVKVLHASV